jgi:hypothetical protein
VVVCAALTCIAWALFSAAIASRVAWQTARPLPSRAEASAMFATVLPGHDLSATVDRSPAMFVMYGHPFNRQDVNSLLFGDGGEYGLGSTTGPLDGLSQDDLRATVDVAQQRLRDTGWTASRPLTRTLDTCGTGSCDEASLPKETYLTAKRGDNILEMYVEYGGVETPQLSIGVGRATPWAVYPASIAGGALGALVAWLVFGWASRRTQRRGPELRAFTTLLWGLAAFLWCAPMPLGAWSMLMHHLSEPHFRWHPLWEWLGQPTFSLFFVLGGGAALTGLAVAALPHGRRGLSTDVATG